MELREQSLSPENTGKDTALNDGPEALNVNEENAETVEMSERNDAGADEVAEPVSKERIVELCAGLAGKEASEVSRDEVARLKQQFYAIRKVELEQEKAAFLEKGNEEAAFAPKLDALEEQFKESLNVIKEKKAALAAEQEAERQKNYERKAAIIEELVEMSSDTDNVNKLFPRFKELQQEFKSVGEVPPAQVSEQWKSYQDAVERFYDQLKINKDLRDYDFKKNLDVKLLLCSEAEKLDAESDIIVAFKRLQELHDKWRETGPVAKEMREEIWTRFKDASTVINKKYQSFFEERKARERDNEAAKTEICERVEAFDFDSLKTYAAWDEMTKAIIAAQEDWKKLGFASKKMNNALFARFRETCDRFFALKADFFRNIKDELTSNLEKKIALCEKAEALKDSTEWKKTTDEMVALQKEWKTIGSVAKKHSDAVWNRFLAACDYFFEQKKKATSGTRQLEQSNLKAKREIIDTLKAISEDSSREDVVKTVKELMGRWQQIGHVPFRDKDKIYDSYRQVVNDLYDRFDIRETKARFANFENSINEMGGDENKLYRERERLVRAYEQKRNELHTYENNLGFFNAKSKTGNSMFKEVERKIQRIKEDLDVLEKKIEVIDSKL
ncbi:MAG: DUF349 domain-containing protein [Muribaculaceae bacterium]|nr:DUF349 domain-containing protein [Muribaculaceae bacterium]